MNDLEKSREEINRIDGEMAKLFEERMGVCHNIAEYKREHGLTIKDPAREQGLINRNRNVISDSEVEGYYVKFLQNMIDLSCSYQAKVINGMRVAYSGVEGAFAYIAAKKMFPEAQLVSYSTFPEAYAAVENGDMDCVVLPIENSYAGEVGTVMDLLFSGSLYINQVLDVEITHNLLVNKGAKLEDIKTVISHSQALAQCDEFIQAHGFATKVSSNTALAAKELKESGDMTMAAIASDETAKIFDLEILENHINSISNNTTRFAAFSRSQNRPVAQSKREDENFILVFTVENEAGSLAQTLNIIGAHGFNMRSLRSRPMKDLLWRYFFYIEAEGNVNTANGREMLQELSAVCAKLKLVGTYFAGNVI